MTKAKSEADKFGSAWTEASKPEASKPIPTILGTGMAKGAADAIKNRHYQIHVKEAEALGEAPMSMDAFMKMNKK